MEPGYPPFYRLVILQIVQLYPKEYFIEGVPPLQTNLGL